MQPVELQRQVLSFVASFEERLPDVVNESVHRQLTEVPELGAAGTEVIEAVWAATSLGAELALAVIRQPASAPREMPAGKARAVIAAVHHDVPLAAVLQTYRIGHAVVLDHLIEHAAETGTSMEVLATASRHLFWYLDSLVPLVRVVYAEEQRRAGGRHDRSRLAAVQRVLDGGDTLAAEYPLDARHVAIVLATTQAPAAMRAVRDALGLRMLAVEAPDGSVWAWLACELCEHDVADVLAEHLHGSAGVSGHEPGVAGFRGSHRKAQLALRLGRRRGAAVTTFGSVTLEALAFGGEELAHEFVAAELGELVAGNRRVAVLRETVAAYFAAGSAAAGAERLGVSERTVTYRLRQAERLLGRPLTTRRAELETALRLRELFAARAAGHGA
jgi:hypothetical protein